jgi:hypothetical protein
MPALLIVYGESQPPLRSRGAVGTHPQATSSGSKGRQEAFLFYISVPL